MPILHKNCKIAHKGRESTVLLFGKMNIARAAVVILMPHCKYIAKTFHLENIQLLTHHRGNSVKFG